MSTNTASGCHREKWTPGILAAQDSLATVDLATAGSGRARLARFSGTAKHGERAEVLRVASVGDPGYGVILPIQEAGLTGRLEAAEDLNVGKLAGLVAAAAAAALVVGGGAAAAVGLVRLNLEQIIYR